MPAISTRSPDNPDFARVVAVRGLSPSAAFAFDLAPDEAEAAALARLFDARSVRKMRFHGALAPEGGGWALDGSLGATVVQTCVVTLEPVTTRVDVPVRRLFLPRSDWQEADVEVLAEEDEDDVEPLGERIDLGLVAIEALALALPDYPRKEGAELPPDVVQPEAAEDETVRPFAGLADLRDKLARDKKE